MKRLLALSVFLMVGKFCFSQNYVFIEPMKIDSVSSEGEEYKPVLSNSGEQLYFARLFHPQNLGGMNSGADIYYSHKINEYWSAPRPLRSLNTENHDELIGISDDNKTVYLRNPLKPHKGILFTRSKDGKYSETELIPIPGLSKSGILEFYMHPSYEVLLVVMESDDASIGQSDIYVCLKNEYGEWESPINLGSTVNTAGADFSPYLTEDKRTLFFASDGHEGYGDADIFVTQKLYDDWNVWSKPVNLGERINSEGFDAYFLLSKDSSAVFASNRDGGLSDLYSTALGGTRLLTLKKLNEVIRPVKDDSGKQYLSTLEISKIFGVNDISIINFSPLGYDLLDEELMKLEVMGKRLNNINNRNVFMEIHSYGDNFNENDDQLARWRALNIVNYLVTVGVDISRINVIIDKTDNSNSLTKASINFYSIIEEQ